jgi:hypothetical protein
LLSKSGRNRAVVWLLLIMSSILFIDLNQPLFAKYASLSPTQFSPVLQLLFFIVTLIAYLFLVLSSSTFAHNRSIRIHAWGKNLLQLFLSSLLVLLVLISLGVGLSTKTILLFLILLIPIMGAVKTAMNLNKLKWYTLSKELSHIALCLLLISIFLTNISNKEDRICLEKNVPFTNKEYSITLQNSIKTIPQYIGEKEQYSLVFLRGSFHFAAYPSIWKYQRNKGLETQKNPFVQILPDADIIIIPKHKGLKTLQLDKETNLDGLIVTLKDYSKTINSQGISLEKAVINFQKEIENVGGEPSFLQEDYSLSRRTTKQGFSMERTWINPTILGEEIEWIDTENDKAILISSNTISKMFEFDIYIKPFMLLLRISYFLMILSLLWMVIMNQWEKKFNENYKRTHPRHTGIRPHHTHHHQ